MTVRYAATWHLAPGWPRRIADVDFQSGGVEWHFIILRIPSEFALAALKKIILKKGVIDLKEKKKATGNVAPEASEVCLK